MKKIFLVLFLINIAFAQNLMLAKKYENQKIEGWLMSEKFDGVRAFWNGEDLISRQGYKFSAPKEFLKNFPNFALDGELFFKRGEFEKTISIIRSKNYEDWQNLNYLIFDVPQAEGGLLKRLEVLEEWLKKNPAPHLKIIEQKKIKDKAEVENFLKEVLAKNGEGVILRNSQTAYENGRTDNFLKLKPQDDAECRVLKHLEGKGKFKGKMGSILCQMDNKKIIKIGTGFKDKDRENPPQIGSLISFKFRGFTKNGLPKFPSFWRLREDKINPQ